MEIIKKDILLCELCNNYKGTAEEKYNGKVPVYCACMVEEERIKYGMCKTFCMLCPNGDKFYWKPISNHYESDGKLWHTPYFCDPHLNRINIK